MAMRPTTSSPSDVKMLFPLRGTPFTMVINDATVNKIPTPVYTHASIYVHMGQSTVRVNVWWCVYSTATYNHADSVKRNSLEGPSAGAQEQIAALQKLTGKMTVLNSKCDTQTVS